VASDLLASLKPWSIEDIVIVDKTYRIPALAAVGWLEILLDDQVSLFAITGLLEPDANADIEEHILNGRYQRDEWEQLTWELVAIAAGRPWWTTLYLIGNAKHVNNVDAVKGELALHGVDATKISLSSWLDAVYRIFTQHMKQEDRQKFDLLLARPPAGIKVKTDTAANRAAFSALMSSG
jgi:hypothetical protein